MRAIEALTWRRVTGGLLVLVVLSGLTWLGWTWRHPTAFEDAGGFGFGGGHHKIGETTYYGMSYPRGDGGGSVTLDGGHPTVASGSGLADTELLICTLEPGHVGAIGSYSGDDIHDDCASLTPVADHRLDLRTEPLRQQVVLAMTLRKPGTVHVTDIVLDYRHGWQRGSQHVGGEVWMSTGTLPEESGFGPH